ncbi:MAG: heavy metal-binding domain-containing protein, partial [Planctomycetota bacterium]
MIKAACGDCGTRYSVDDSYAGATAKCRKCGGEIIVSAVASVPSVSPSLEKADEATRDVAGEDGGLSGTRIATTDVLHGWTILEYHGLVTSHVVAGTGFFADFAAGMTDFFGGRSETYQRQMAAIEEDALAALRQSAAARGANWVIGARIDFDQISGKGMQMFMVSAQGTAVRAVAAPAVASQATRSGLVAGSLARNAIKRQRAMHLVARVESGQEEVTEDLLATLSDARLSESILILLGAAMSDTGVDKAGAIATQGLRIAPRHDVRQALQDALLRQPCHRVANDLYRDLGLLDLNWVLEQMRAEDQQARHAALRMLC